MNKISATIPTLILMVFLFSNCEQEPTYESMVQAGKNSGVEKNDLFLQYQLGMTRDDFFKVSWEMNKEEKISGLVKIDYEFNELKSRALMRFYPDFVDDRISKMPVDVHYVGWAPWNAELSSDSLAVDLVEYYEEIYETSFNQVYVPHLEKQAFVSVDGNREISIYPLTEMVTRVDFTDLNAVDRL